MSSLDKLAATFGANVSPAARDVVKLLNQFFESTLKDYTDPQVSLRHQPAENAASMRYEGSISWEPAYGRLAVSAESAATIRVWMSCGQGEGNAPTLDRNIPLQHYTSVETATSDILRQISAHGATPFAEMIAGGVSALRDRADPEAARNRQAAYKGPFPPFIKGT